MPLTHDRPATDDPQTPSPELTLTQVDGSYQLDVTTPPAQRPPSSGPAATQAPDTTSPDTISPDTISPDTSLPEPSPSDASQSDAPQPVAPSGFGAGSQPATHTAPSSYLISPTDSEAIARSLAALASGAATLSTP